MLLLSKSRFFRSFQFKGFYLSSVICSSLSSQLDSLRLRLLALLLESSHLLCMLPGMLLHLPIVFHLSIALLLSRLFLHLLHLELVGLHVQGLVCGDLCLFHGGLLLGRSPLILKFCHLLRQQSCLLLYLPVVFFLIGHVAYLSFLLKFLKFELESLYQGIVIGSAHGSLLRGFLFSILDLLCMPIFRKSVLLGRLGPHLLHRMLVGLHVQRLIRDQLGRELGGFYLCFLSRLL